MIGRLAALVVLAAGIRGCVAYEYEHEIWLNVDGSGTLRTTGRPELWTAFKGLGSRDHPGATVTRDAVRELYERSGLRVRRTTLTHRRGRAYVYVSADFEDVNALSATPAFPDLRIAMRREGERIRLEGTWIRPPGAPDVKGVEADGLMAVRFHLPSKVYDHANAADGVERGNILGWRQTVAAALGGESLRFGALMDRRSILFSTVLLFGGAILVGLGLVASGLYYFVRRGRRSLADAVAVKGEDVV
jgi:hypothetical protein